MGPQGGKLQRRQPLRDRAPVIGKGSLQLTWKPPCTVTEGPSQGAVVWTTPSVHVLTGRTQEKRTEHPGHSGKKSDSLTTSLRRLRQIILEHILLEGNTEQDPQEGRRHRESQGVRQTLTGKEAEGRDTAEPEGRSRSPGLPREDSQLHPAGPSTLCPGRTLLPSPFQHQSWGGGAAGGKHTNNTSQTVQVELSDHRGLSL